MDTSVTVAPQTRQAVAVVDRSAPGKVTGKLRRAIDAMVWEGARRPEAAAIAGLTDHSLRSALRKPHVKAHYLAECEVLRTSGRARRIHRLAEISEQSVNLNAAVAAIKATEMVGDEVSRSNASAAQSPGFIINIVQAAAAPSHALPSAPQRPAIEAQPVDNTAERE